MVSNGVCVLRVLEFQGGAGTVQREEARVGVEESNVYTDAGLSSNARYSLMRENRLRVIVLLWLQEGEEA